jgi:hypothetical protein
MGGGENPAPVDLLPGSTVSGGVRTKTGILNAAAGNYLLTIDLYGAAGNAGKTEVVHIYSNTETEAPAAKYTFSSGVFNPTAAYQTGSQSLYDVLAAIGAASGTDFTVILNQDEPAFAPFTFTAASFGGKKLRIRGGGHTVTLSGTGSLFTLETGAALVLQDLELHGQGLEIDNNGALISVTGGDLLINPGTVITGNSTTSSGGGVDVYGGAFTMSGGTITGNSSSSYPGGGGIYVSGGTFTMSGGTITGNSSSSSSSSSTPTSFGGGVYVVSDGIFTMSGGTISGNSSSSSSPYYSYSYGGGVFVSTGIFTISGGTILGNSSSSSSSSSSSIPYYSYGGGVCVVSDGTFTMSGGTILGNSSSSSSSSYSYSSGGGVLVTNSTFTMSGGTISGNSSSSVSSSGGGVSVSSGSTFTMNGGTISDNSSNIGGGVSVRNGTFVMGSNARIDPSNEVYLYSEGSNSITLAGDFSGNDTIAVIDLGGGAADLLGKPVLLRNAGYTGTIPVDRFTLGNFVSSDYSSGAIIKTPITSYVIDSEGRLMNK